MFDILKCKLLGKEVNVEDSTTKPSLPLAGFSVRLLALFIDNYVALPIVILIVFVVPEPLLVALAPAARSLLWSLLWLIFPLLYYVPSWTLLGAGPGGNTLGLRIVQRDGSPIGFGKAIIRFLASIVPAALISLGYLKHVIGFLVFVVLMLLIGLGYLWAAFDPQRQTWHDKIASTFVLRDRAAHPLRLLALLLIPMVLWIVLGFWGLTQTEL